MAIDTAGKIEASTETTVGEAMRDELTEKASKIEENIAGIEKKLKRKDVTQSERVSLNFHLQKANCALLKCQEDLSDFARI
jgi:hypothetical protein